MKKSDCVDPTDPTKPPCFPKLGSDPPQSLWQPGKKVEISKFFRIDFVDEIR